MREIEAKEITKTVARLFDEANFFLSDDVLTVLKKAKEDEESPAGREALAKILPAYPDLDNPQHRFLLLLRDDGLWFGEVLVKCEHSYERHDAKPHHTTVSLPSRLARALVNLVVPPAGSLIDVCCGTGSVLLEAQALGIPVYGADWSWHGVQMAKKNLAHFGYQAQVERADARTCTRTAEALVTDLPYGRISEEDKAITRAILERGRRLAPVAVYVSGYSITDWLAAAGYREVEQYQVRKHTGFVRYVHVARG